MVYSHNVLLRTDEDRPKLRTAIWLNLTKIMLNRRSQIQKSRHCIIPLDKIQERAKLVSAIRSQQSGCLTGAGIGRGHTVASAEL